MLQSVGEREKMIDDRYIRMCAVDQAIETKHPGEAEGRVMARAERIAAYIITGEIVAAPDSRTVREVGGKGG